MSQERLKQLFRDRKSLMQLAQDTVNQASEHTTKDGVIVPKRFDDEITKDLLDFEKRIRGKVKAVETDMERELSDIPIYKEFFRKVWGCGPMTAAVLIASVNPRFKEDRGLGTTKPSTIVQFCGFGISNGKLSRLTKGKTRDYNPHLRECLFNMYTSMSKLRGAFNKVNKYLVIYDNKKHSMLTRPQLADAKPMTPGFAHAAAWHTAMRVFIEDMYIIWRAQEGLPIWPSFAVKQTGYAHGGVPTMNVPVEMTLGKAWELVGHVGRYCPKCDSQKKCECFPKKEKIEAIPIE